MEIFIHPKNMHLIESIKREAVEQTADLGFYPASIFGYRVTVTDTVPELTKSATEFDPVGNDRYTEFPTESPAEWEIFCGYVKPKMVPTYFMIDRRKSSIFSPSFYRALPSPEGLTLW